MTQDEQHLNLLAVFHYVVGSIAALIAMFPIFHLLLGVFFILYPGSLEGKGDPPPPAVGWLFVIVAAFCILVGWVFAALIIAAGRCLARRKHYLFCLVMAGIECMFMPLGTVLGVFTIIVLMRESVKPLFGRPLRITA